jgi:predicted GIY-YIG superfamily endonuclease
MEEVKNVVAPAMLVTSRGRIRLGWRHIMDTLSPHVKSSKPPKYTVYALLDPRDQSVKYIGITKDVYSRMRQHSRCEGNNTAKNAWITELQREQLMFIMHSLEKVRTFEQALKREEAWIKAYLDAGISLLNIAVAQSYQKLSSQPDVVSSGRRQKFRVPDLCKVTFRVEGQLYRADMAPPEIFQTFISEYVDNSTARDWIRIGTRSFNLSKLWEHSQEHHYEFPFEIEEEKEAAK